MESNDVISKLKNVINQLEELKPMSLGIHTEKVSEKEKKEISLLTKIVNFMHEILSDNYKKMKENNQKIQVIKGNKSYYWDFISKHFNTPVVRFTILYEKEKGESSNTFIQKGKNWIYFSILEKSLYDSIFEIYKAGLEKIYYTNESIIIQQKYEILNLLKDLHHIHLISITNKEYKKYLDFCKINEEKNPRSSFCEDNFENDELAIWQSPIMKKRTINKNNTFFENFEFLLPIVPIDSHLNNKNNINVFQSEFNEENEYDELLNFDFIDEPKKEENIKPFTHHSNADFSPNIEDNFYSFSSKRIEVISTKPSDEEINALNINSVNEFMNEEENYKSCNIKEEFKKKKSGLILNPQISKHLPCDNLYEIFEKDISKGYKLNDKIIYNKKKRKITNCLLYYLNKYYKKAPFHKFIKHNYNNSPITLKKQNYQCYICLKKILHFSDIPIESIYWCSYYMRYVCKDCIDSEISIIPHFVLKKWCFEKFSISKRAKHTLEQWYSKPIIF